MTKEEKLKIVEELTAKLASTNYFYITDAAALTVNETVELRKQCYKAGVEYKVYKNTFIKKALENQEADYSELYGVLKGFSGIMFSPEVGNAPARVIEAYRKDNGSELPLLKGAGIDTACYVGDENLKALSSLKSKNELIGDVIGLLQSPAKNVISALSSGGAKIAGILKTLSEKEEN